MNDVVDNGDLLMNFFIALRIVADGGKVTKLEWKDKRTYGYLKDGFLQLHKAGEAEAIVHPWIINDGDLLGEDWIQLYEESISNNPKSE